jgi:hypothetical protein
MTKPKLKQKQRTTGLTQARNGTADGALGRMVDAGWKAFWARRNRRPPALSRDMLHSPMDTVSTRRSK